MCVYEKIGTPYPLVITHSQIFNKLVHSRHFTFGWMKAYPLCKTLVLLLINHSRYSPSSNHLISSAVNFTASAATQSANSAPLWQPTSGNTAHSCEST